MKKIRVLIVDDSLLFREIFSKMLNSDPNIEVVATAADAFEARDKLLQYHPDVMTLDVQMPKMNGIEFLRRLMPQYPIPTIVISGTDDYDDSVFEAISLGAVDFVKKPDGNIVVTGKEFFDDLIFKVKIAAAAKVQKEKNVIRKPVIEERISHSKKKIVAIGASTGGTVAITNLLEGISPPIPPILIVQHIPPVFSNMFAQRLNETFSFDVKEAESGDLVLPGRVLIAPGNKHMIAKKVGSTVKVECFEGEKVNGHCPAVDVLFDSMAAFGSEVVGVILTGMGYDGAKGLLKMRKQGAYTIGQNEKSSVVYGMPKVAYSIGAVEIQLSLEQIAGKINAVV